ncbi:MAG: hypothetical protein ABJK37_04775 [Paraglaciecola sp.]|uniref:hypothetical protein n=1 Tax=Paraglaciecola sp. TaxID=1920173 RepID=UPI0032979039
MTSDLLFSILPREGKVPIAHDSQKVVQIDKQEKLRALSDEEKELKNEEKDARKKQQQQGNNQQNQEKVPNSETSGKPDEESVDGELKKDNEHKKPKGPKHLDIYV